jgi:hypothetical protein
MLHSHGDQLCEGQDNGKISDEAKDVTIEQPDWTTILQAKREYAAPDASLAL